MAPSTTLSPHVLSAIGRVVAFARRPIGTVNASLLQVDAYRMRIQIDPRVRFDSVRFRAPSSEQEDRSRTPSGRRMQAHPDAHRFGDLLECAMPKAAHARHVDLFPETIWLILLDAADHPERYNDTVEACHVVARRPNAWTRQLDGEHGCLVEEVVVDHEEMTVRTELVGHPVYSGSYVRRVEENDDGTCVVAFEIDWLRVDGQPDGEDADELLEEAVDKVVHLGFEVQDRMFTDEQELAAFG